MPSWSCGLSLGGAQEATERPECAVKPHRTCSRSKHGYSDLGSTSNLLPPDYKPAATPISWATLHICDSEGTGPLGPVGSPAPSTSPCCCSWTAVVGWPGSGWPQPAPWTKVVCTHVISANYPGFSKLADSRGESQAARSRCPAEVSPLHLATAGLDPDAQDFTSPGCVCPHRLRGRHVLASECLCVSAAVRVERPLRQVWEADGQRERMRSTRCFAAKDSASTLLPQPPWVMQDPGAVGAAAQSWSVPQEAATSASLLQVA